MIRRLAFFLVAAAALVMLAGASHAERAWIKDELRLNIRTGPGVKYRILGVLGTGDSLEILSRGEGWTQVRAPGGMDGWIPEGYLQAETPARIRLERYEAETTALRTDFEKLSAEVVDLRDSNQQLSEQESKQRGEIDLLTRENLELSAGARGPEWITGASILFVGAILGVIVHRSASRRPAPRIRL
jgi:SH3 domain protein